MFYHLALETIGRMFADLRSTGILEASFEGPRRVTYHARVVIVEGKLAECAVSTSNGEIVMVGSNAYNAISQRVLKWNFTPTRPSALTSSSSSGPLPVTRDEERNSGERQLMTLGQRVPFRTHEVSPAELATWPRHYRTIYFLINGINTVDRIERLTSLPVHVITSILQQLEERGYIRLR